MGLDTSHDAFHGAYSAFNRFRQAVCRAAGGSFPPHHPDTLTVLGISPNEANREWFYLPNGVTRETSPGLYCFLGHSDCDGEISPEDCRKVADELEALLPKLDEMGSGGGHLEREGGYGRVARKFIAGCRLAAERNEPLDFH